VTKRVTESNATFPTPFPNALSNPFPSIREIRNSAHDSRVTPTAKGIKTFRMFRKQDGCSSPALLSLSVIA
jgi:hypothetical protein